MLCGFKGYNKHQGTTITHQHIVQRFVPLDSEWHQSSSWTVKSENKM
jgi:hypothetical protein